MIAVDSELTVRFANSVASELLDVRQGGRLSAPWHGFDLEGFTMGLFDSQALYAAETPGAPVQLKAVEPAIGGIEVGVIGAFAAAVADPAAFVKLTPP